MKNYSKVTVVLAVYNGEKYLGSAIESALAQSYAPLDIVVVDDGSDDSTEEVAKRYPVRYFRRPHVGQPAAQNFGIQASEGEYLAFLDADDLYLPEKTALQLAFLEKRQELDFVFGHVRQFFSPELSPEERKKWICPPGTSPGYLAAAGLFRKTCFERAGLFNEQQRIGGFIDWYMRAQEKGLQGEVTIDPVLLRRIHGANVGIQFKQSRMEYVQIVKAALQRRAAL